MAKTRSSGASYSSHGAKYIKNPNGSGEFTSYGEGWEHGYHVYLTDAIGYKSIDKGRIGGHSIGETVAFTGSMNGVETAGEIKEAELSSSGRVRYAVKVPDSRDAIMVNSENVRKVSKSRADAINEEASRILAGRRLSTPEGQREFFNRTGRMPSSYYGF